MGDLLATAAIILFATCVFLAMRHLLREACGILSDKDDADGGGGE